MGAKLPIEIKNSDYRRNLTSAALRATANAVSHFNVELIKTLASLQQQAERGFYEHEISGVAEEVIDELRTRGFGVEKVKGHSCDYLIKWDKDYEESK